MKFKGFITNNSTWIIALLFSAYPITMMIKGLISDITPSMYQSTSNIIWLIYRIISGFCICLFTTLCLFILPIKIIILMAKGKTFNKSNVRNLHAIAYFLLFVVFLSFFENFTFYIKMKTSHHDPLIEQLLIKRLLPSHYIWFFIAGILVFVIARIFKKGYLLQKEQKLTI